MTHTLQSRVAAFLIGIGLIWGLGGAVAWACSVTPLFSPYDNVEAAIHPLLVGAKSSIACSLFGISNEALGADLVNAAHRGVTVTVGIDLKQSRLKSDLHSQIQLAGATVVVKPVSVLEHNKFCVIDGVVVVMGSWNWSGNAGKQDNSDLVIDNRTDPQAWCQHVIEAFMQAQARILARDQRP